MATNTQMIRGEWKQLCTQARKRWHQLTDDDLKAVEGNVEELVTRIQQKTGEGRDVIEKFVTEMSSKASSAFSDAAETAGQYAHQVGDEVRLRYSNAQGTVRHHPLETVLAALGIGLVAGLFVGIAGRSR